MTIISLLESTHSAAWIKGSILIVQVSPPNRRQTISHSHIWDAHVSLFCWNEVQIDSLSHFAALMLKFDNECFMIKAWGRASSLSHAWASSSCLFLHLLFCRMDSPWQQLTSFSQTWSIFFFSSTNDSPPGFCFVYGEGKKHHIWWISLSVYVIQYCTEWSVINSFKFGCL